LIFEFLELRFKDVFCSMAGEKKMTKERKMIEEDKLYEEKKAVDPFISGFYESMEKTNTKKITREILADLSEDSDNSDEYDAESGDEDSKDRPWRPSHTIFGKSTIKQSHVDAMRGRYFRDMTIVRVGGDSSAPAPEVNEVVIYRSFLKAGLRFPLSRFLVEVLKTFQIFLHQLTPKAIIRMGLFVWAVRSQGLEPSTKCFCSMHELLYETKATGKEQYHNNFICYRFVARSNASHLVPTFRKRWPRAWMEEWFYVKNDLIEREDIKEIIQRPIWSRFGLRRPKVTIDQNDEACQKAFSNICAFIGTRDVVQEHIAYKIWPLVEYWDMPKDTTAESTEGGLVRLKYTFRFRDRFDEPNDDWLKSIEAISDELLGAYSRAEDDALSTAFGGRGKKRLNRVFDAIGFVYPNYRYPLRGQGKKRKTAALATTVVPKGKKVKVLTHRPRYIEPAVVPEFGEGASSTSEARQAAPIVQSVEEPTVVPKMPTVGPIEAEDHKTEEPKVEETMKMPEILSPPAEAKLPKVQKAPVATPKRRRMASILDAVIETMKALTPAPTKKAAEAAKIQEEAEAGPSAPTETKAAKPEDKVSQQISDTGKTTEQGMAEKAKSLAPKPLSRMLIIFIVMLRGRSCPKKKLWKPNTMREN
jgi:hypothetical protein